MESVEVVETQLQPQIIDASYATAQKGGVVSQHHRARPCCCITRDEKTWSIDKRNDARSSIDPISTSIVWEDERSNAHFVIGITIGIMSVEAS